MAAGNYNSANLNSSNFRTDAAAASPLGNYTLIGYIGNNFRIDGGTRPAGNFSVYAYITNNFRIDGDWITVSDSAYLVEAWSRVLGEISIDDVVLPHVLSINISEPVNLDSRPVNTGLPIRDYEGKKGRTVMISGWTQSLTELNQIIAYADGTKRVLILPTGEGFYAYISRVPTPRTADNPNEYPYTLEAQEAID